MDIEINKAGLHRGEMWPHFVTGGYLLSSSVSSLKVLSNIVAYF